MSRNMAVFFAPLGVVLIGIALAAQQTATEAPRGFDTPTLSDTPGLLSVSNGIAEPPGDTFALDQFEFERKHSPGGPIGSLGLGPDYNAAACADCHQNVVTGAASQFTELRAGHIDANGNFANPTIPIDGGNSTITGRSIVNDRAICEAAIEHLPDSENVRSLRAVLNTLGDGFVEAVDDRTLIAIAANQLWRDSGDFRMRPEKIRQRLQRSRANQRVVVQQQQQRSRRGGGGLVIAPGKSPVLRVADQGHTGEIRRNHLRRCV